MATWLQKARNLFFPEEAKQPPSPQQQQQSESHADMKRQRSTPDGSKGKDSRGFQKSQSAKQQTSQQQQRQQPASSTAKVPPGARVVRQVIKEEPVLIEAEALDKKHAGFQGLLWYVLNKKQDKHGDIADEFLEEGSKPSQLARQQQVKPASSLAVKDVDKGNVFLVQTKRAKQ